MFFRKKEFGSGKYDFIIAGLGNPGAKYEMTRHNAGFLSMDLLSIEEGVDIKKFRLKTLLLYMTIFHLMSAKQELGAKALQAAITE